MIILKHRENANGWYLLLEGGISSNPGNSNNARNVNHNGNVDWNNANNTGNNGVRAASLENPVLLD